MPPIANFIIAILSAWLGFIYVQDETSAFLFVGLVLFGISLLCVIRILMDLAKYLNE